MASKATNFISRAIQGGNQLLSCLSDTAALREEWNSLNYDNILIPEDFEGENDHLTPTDLKRYFGVIQQVRRLLTATTTAEFDAAVTTIRAVASQLYGQTPPVPLYAILFKLKR